MRWVAYYTVLLAFPVVWAGDSERSAGRPIEIGVRGAAMFGPGDPTNDIVGAGVFGRVRTAPGWAIGIGLDQLNYGVETPNRRGRAQGTRSGRSEEEQCLPGWIERRAVGGLSAPRRLSGIRLSSP